MEKIDPQDEILAAACKALDKAHDLLSFVVRYNGKTTPEFVAACREWVDGEYDPGGREPAKCKHVPMKSALDNSVGCIRCGVLMGEAQ